MVLQDYVRMQFLAKSTMREELAGNLLVHYWC